MTRLQKILNKALPKYLNSGPRFMCHSLKDAWLSDEITWEEHQFAIQEINTYLKHLGPHISLVSSLESAGICFSIKAREQIYRNWADRPITSPTLEQRWITQALNYGEGVWEGLKIAEDVGDLTCTQVDIVKYSIEQFGREPTIQELKDWTAVQQQN